MRHTIPIVEPNGYRGITGSDRHLSVRKNGVLTAKKAASKKSVYNLIEVIGSSTTSCEDAARNAVETAAKTLRDLRIAEVVKMDIKVENGKFREWVSSEEHFIEPAGIAVNSQGHSCVFHQGKHPLMDFVPRAHSFAICRRPVWDRAYASHRSGGRHLDHCRPN